jgi:GNAT superfamily N-acetyltransferase
MTYPAYIRTFAADEWRTYRDLRLRALADAPDAFSRTLDEEKSRPDAEWSSRLSSGVDSCWDLPLVGELDNAPIGLAWGRIEPPNLDIATLYQMWVAPGYRNLGVGRMLLERVIKWARAADVQYLALGVTCGDSPAMRLYLRAGFKPVGKPEPLRSESEVMSQPMRLALRMTD